MAQAQAQHTVTRVAYPVTNINVQEIAPKVRELVAGAGQDAEILIDRSQNRLLIEGDGRAHSVARQVLASLDVPGRTAAGPSAAQQQPVLRTLPVPATDLRRVSVALQLKYQANPAIRISGDDRTGQLLVLAPPPVQVEVAQFVQQQTNRNTRVSQAAAEMGAPMRQRFRLVHIGWQQFEDQLQQLGGGRVPVTTHRAGEVATFQLTGFPAGNADIEVDRRAGEVTVVAPENALAAWRQVIGAIQLASHTAAESTHLVRLQKAEPAPIQRAIQLMRTLPSAPGGQTAAGGNARMTPAVLRPQQQPQAGGAPQPAAAQAGDDEPTTGVIPTDPDVQGEDLTGLFGDVQLQIVPELGVIIVRGARRDVQRVLEVIRQIEEQSELTRPQVEVYQLQHANSIAVAELINELYEDVLAPRQGQVSITALDKPNALLMIGREEAIASVIELLEEIDQPVPASSQLEVFPLEHASAIDAEATLRSFFVAAPGTDEAVRPGLGTRVRIVADYRTNALIVQAAPRDLKEVALLIEKIDTVSTPAQSEIRVFRLQNTIAEDLQPVLEAAITGENADATEGRVTPPSTELSIVSLDDNGNKLIDSGILAGAVITADPNVNALVVKAPSNSMPLIAELIRQLDQPPGAESIIKVFTIENGDATSLAQALQELFGLAVTAGQGTTGGIFGTSNALNRALVTGAGEDSLVPLRFSVDTRTNSIIATGSQSDLEVVETLLLRLDTEGFATRRTEVIWLRNALAVDIATALTQYINQQIQLFQTNATFNVALGPFDQMERDLVVVPEPTTNSLIISAPPRIFDDIIQIVDVLDRRPPMVMVKVVIAEVELTDGFEFGSELGIQDSLLFDRSVIQSAASTNTTSGVLNPGFNFINPTAAPSSGNLSPLSNSASPASVSSADSLAGQAVSSFLVGRSSSTFGYGGLVLSAASDSINILIRALQDANRLQVLSRPMVMTLDSTPALIQDGAQVPRVVSVSQTGLSGPVIETQDISVGLILAITPRVSPDGLIVMNIDATRSSVGDPEEGIPVGFDANGNPIRSPQIPTTTAQSVISAFSGQTVVFGGLIQKERRQFSRRVPYISDIPVLGNFFRFDQEIERRKELLIFMTPMIVSSDQDVEYVKATESARMSWCLADVIEMHGNVGMSAGYGLWGPATGNPIIYPDLQPTVDSHPPDAIIEDVDGDQFYLSPQGVEEVPVPPHFVPESHVVPEVGAVPPSMRSGGADPRGIQTAQPSLIPAGFNTQVRFAPGVQPADPFGASPQMGHAGQPMTPQPHMAQQMPQHVMASPANTAPVAASRPLGGRPTPLPMAGMPRTEGRY